MSKPAYYLCPEHGRVAVRTPRRAAPIARCPRCVRDVPRAPREAYAWRFVSIPATTYARLQAHSNLVGLSLGALVDVLTRDLGGAR